MITYSFENPYDIKDSLQELCFDHFSEDFRKEASNLTICWEIYDSLYEEDTLICCIARDSDTIVGYATAFVVLDLHTQDNLLGKLDTLYVSKAYRSKGVAKELLAKLEQKAYDKGASWFCVTFRDESKAEAFLSSTEYKKTEVSFSKNLMRDC